MKYLKFNKLYMKKFLKVLGQLFISNKFYCFHKYKIGTIRQFTTEKMDSYGNVSCNLQYYSCEKCGKIKYKAV